jgi:hypothetical protein
MVRFEVVRIRRSERLSDLGAVKLHCQSPTLPRQEPESWRRCNQCQACQRAAGSGKAKRQMPAIRQTPSLEKPLAGPAVRLAPGILALRSLHDAAGQILPPLTNQSSSLM